MIILLYSQGARILSTGWGVLNHVDGVTPEGLQEVFATNLFGHFVMVRVAQKVIVKRSKSKIVNTKFDLRYY